MTLMIIIWKYFNLKAYVTASHLDAIARILIFISLMMGTAYLTEIFVGWYSGNKYEIFTFFHNRITGSYTIQFWIMFTSNALIPQLLWIKKLRKKVTVLFIISIIINIGMWFERFNIVVTSLSKDFLPANWAPYHASWVEIGTYVGTLGFFTLGVLFFFRYIPMIAISEIKGVLKFNKKSK